MSEKLSEETRALMGTFAAAEAALAEAAAVWRQFRQPRVDTAAGHKKADAMEREAQFRLANAALLWLWHVEERAARAEARPAVDREGEPSEDFIRLVAEAMGARTGYSISLTRLVDGVETYTLSMDGYEPQDFDDRDEAAEVLHQRLNRNRAKRLLALLGSSSANRAARIASDHAASETLRKSEEG